MFSGAREIAVITNPNDLDQFKQLLGVGAQIGLEISYVPQPSPRGIGDAIARCSTFLGNERCVVVLGDNLFHGSGFGMSLERVGRDESATVFAYSVADPSPYAVVDFDSRGLPSILVEKPVTPRSNWAVPGLYFLPIGAAEEARQLPVSDRGESEVTDLNRMYMQAGILEVLRASRGSMWMDVGTPDRLFAASMYVESIAQRQGMSISCPEEVALRKGWITEDAFALLAHESPSSLYGDYLRSLIES